MHHGRYELHGACSMNAVCVSGLIYGYMGGYSCERKVPSHGGSASSAEACMYYDIYRSRKSGDWEVIIPEEE